MPRDEKGNSKGKERERGKGKQNKSKTQNNIFDRRTDGQTDSAGSAMRVLALTAAQTIVSRKFHIPTPYSIRTGAALLFSERVVNVGSHCVRPQGVLPPLCHASSRYWRNMPVGDW